MTTTEYNPFAVAQLQLDEAAEKLGLDDATREFLRWPIREYVVTLPVRMDDGSTRVFRGYRVQYNNSRGPTKGGLRWHPDETIDAVRALAASMTWKTSVMDIPLGGGQGGITCNPKELSRTNRNGLPAPTCAWSPRFSARHGTCPPPMSTPPPRSWRG